MLGSYILRIYESCWLQVGRKQRGEFATGPFSDSQDSEVWFKCGRIFWTRIAGLTHFSTILDASTIVMQGASSLQRFTPAVEASAANTLHHVASPYHEACRRNNTRFCDHAPAAPKFRLGLQPPGLRQTEWCIRRKFVLRETRRRPERNFQD